MNHNRTCHRHVFANTRSLHSFHHSFGGKGLEEKEDMKAEQQRWTAMFGSIADLVESTTMNVTASMDTQMLINANNIDDDDYQAVLDQDLHNNRIA